MAMEFLQPALDALPVDKPYMILPAIIIVGGCYLLGSIPFGLILTRLAGLGDIRSIGSGNIGSTNVLRTGKKWMAALTLLLDMGKAFAGIWFANWWMLRFVVHPQATNVAEATNNIIANTNLLGVAAAAIIIGHMFPIWLRFRGGKGVACVFGIGFGLYIPLGLYCAGIWFGVFMASHISSLAGLAMVVGFGSILYFQQPLLWIPALVIPLLVIAKHLPNIHRLLAGTEHRFSLNSADTSADDKDKDTA